jgi:hypothetical protein
MSRNLFPYYVAEATMNLIMFFNAVPNGRAIEGVGLKPFDYWDSGFESQ